MRPPGGVKVTQIQKQIFTALVPPKIAMVVTEVTVGVVSVAPIAIFTALADSLRPMPGHLPDMSGARAGAPG